MMYSLFYLWHSLLWMSHAFIKTCAVLELSSTTTMEIVLKRKKRKSPLERATAPEAGRRQWRRQQRAGPVLLWGSGASHVPGTSCPEGSGRTAAVI